METLAEQFGRNLRRERRHLGVSQDRFAIMAKLHRTEISLIERGGRLPRLDTIARLAAGLGIDPLQLLRGIDWTADPK